MELLSPVKRAGIFVFYDKDGIVDRYVQYLLNDLRSNIELLVVVCNGKLTPEGRKLFERVADVIYVRENIGLDAAGYREGIVKCLGWEKIDQFDEIVLLNDTFYGPFFPFSKVFEEMNGCDVDFWGLTEHYESPGIPGLGKNGVYPDHIQTYFLAIRKKMLVSREFHEYWDNMPIYENFNQVVGNHEVLFTEHFRNCGFRAKAYVELSDLREISAPNINYYTYAPGSLLQKRKFCAIKRKDFVLEHSELLVHSGGEELRNALDYVQTQTNYDVGMIWENLLRLYEVTKLKQALHLNYILPDNSNISTNHNEYKDICVIFGCEHEALISEMVEKIKSLPDLIPKIIITNLDQNRDRLLEQFKSNEVVIACSPDMDWWNYVYNYKYVCYVRDANVPTVDANYVAGASYRYLLQENLIHSIEYIDNVIETFEKNPQLGILAPPLPIHSTYYRTFGRQWDDCLQDAQAISNELGIKQLPNEKTQPIMIDFSAWYRVASIETAITAVTAINLKYNKRALCRILPLIAQNNGYYSGWVMTTNYASLSVSNLEYMAEKVCAALHSSIPTNRFAELMAVIPNTKDDIPAIGVKGALKIWLKKRLPASLIKVLKKIKYIFRKL